MTTITSLATTFSLTKHLTPLHKRNAVTVPRLLMAFRYKRHLTHLNTATLRPQAITTLRPQAITTLQPQAITTLRAQAITTIRAQAIIIIHQ